MPKIQPKAISHMRNQENATDSQPAGANLDTLKLSDKATEGTTS